MLASRFSPLSALSLTPHRFVAASVATLALSTLALVASAPAARAQTPIIDFTGGTTTGNAIDRNIGFDFTVTGSQIITNLGIFDTGANGLANSHTVSLYNNSGSELASILITTANSTAVPSTSTFGNYRTVVLGTPVVLIAGTYVLGATYFNGDNDGVLQLSSASSTLGFAYGNSRFITGTSTPTFPTNTATANNAGIVGPMAFTASIAGAAAPEPGTIALLALAGLPAVGMIARRRGRKRLAARETA